MKNIKSLRGALIKTLTHYILKDLLFEPVHKVMPILQEALDNNLNFETKVNNITIIEGYTVGQIIFSTGGYKSGTVDFTISNKIESNDEYKKYYTSLFKLSLERMKKSDVHQIVELHHCEVYVLPLLKQYMTKDEYSDCEATINSLKFNFETRLGK